MRRQILTLVALILGVTPEPTTVAAQPASAQAVGRPNVVLILMDDMGYGDLGSYGGRDARTPNVDRLAREGVRLTDAYANGAVCTPTRAALISGRYPQRVGLETALTVTATDQERGLPVAGHSLPALLKANGYATGLIGKWHLGWKPEFGPNAHGFDEFYGFLSGAHYYYTAYGRDTTPDLFENLKPVKAEGYLTDVITQRAVGFITRHAGEPFFLEVAYNAVHWPFEPPDLPPASVQANVPRPFAQMPGDSVPATRRDYVRMLERADQGVGDILAALERLRLDRNTLVIFTNDNGGEWLSRNAPLSHRKNTLWEGGIRVPLILRWPAGLPAGKTSPQTAITLDLHASILAATGSAAPAGYVPDGIDLLPVLRGAPVVERQLFWRINNPGRRQLAVRSGRWKLLVDGGQLLLFDVGSDPGERSELAAQHPEVVVKLRQWLTEWTQAVNAGRQ